MFYIECLTCWATRNRDCRKRFRFEYDGPLASNLKKTHAQEISDRHQFWNRRELRRRGRDVSTFAIPEPGIKRHLQPLVLRQPSTVPTKGRREANTLAIDAGQCKYPSSGVTCIGRIAGRASALLGVLQASCARSSRCTQDTLLGVIVEVPLAVGLDALAASSEGGVRYLNQSGKLVVIEGVPQFLPMVKRLFEVSQPVVQRIGPWTKPRLAPPKPGNVRLTFLVSGGLYFGEGEMAVMQQEPMAEPIIGQATELLQAVVETGAK